MLAKRADGLSPVAKIGVLATHKSVGITILALAVLRLAWRLFNPVRCSRTAPRWQAITAHVSHFLLYALLFIMPVLGWLMSSAPLFQRQLFRPVHAAGLHRAEPPAYERLHDVHESMA